MSYRYETRMKTIRKELQRVNKKERNLRALALDKKPAQWRSQLEETIPQKVSIGLQKAFATGFSVVFRQGRALIEKTYNKEEIKADHTVLDYALQIKGTRKEMWNMRASASAASTLNLAMTTIEGIGLGALGVGMPDIILFISTMLKGIYETALHYGFSYESEQEQLLILKMMAAAMSSGKEWVERDAQVDQLLLSNAVVSQDHLDQQIQETASVFAVDMLLLKFIQGIPVVGVIGGMANPVYYRKVLQYVQLKYYKRYLHKQLSGYECLPEERNPPQATNTQFHA